MIEGGYYLKAKRIQESAIMHAPPHVREIWDWLLMKAMFKDGSNLERGQVLATYDDIRDGLSWFVGFRKERYSKWDCERAMKILTKEQMIATTKTTRGLIITILNYSYYQNPMNYESHNESHNEATRKPQPTDTIENEVKKEERNSSTLPKGKESPDDTDDHCPHQEIIASYHQELPSLPKVKEWTKLRASMLRQRWKEKPDRRSLEFWQKLFQYVSLSDFLMGRTDKPFRCDLEWLIRPKNFIKVLEGKYHTNRGPALMSASSNAASGWAERERQRRAQENDR